MKYTCPVCGFNGMEAPPERFHICACCGTEFAYDDLGTTHAELRRVWVKAGGKWWDEDTPPPAGWSAYEQLTRAGYSLDATRLENITTNTTARIVPGRNTYIAGQRIVFPGNLVLGYIHSSGSSASLQVATQRKQHA